MNVCKTVQAQKPKPKYQRLTSVKPMPQKPFQIRAISQIGLKMYLNLNLKTKQSANTKQKLHYKEHAGQPGVEDKWSKYDMKKKTKEGNAVVQFLPSFLNKHWNLI